MAQPSCNDVRTIINGELNDYSRETLRVLVRHLATVAEHAAANKMTVENLAMVRSQIFPNFVI